MLLSTDEIRHIRLLVAGKRDFSPSPTDYPNET